MTKSGGQTAKVAELRCFKISLDGHGEEQVVGLVIYRPKEKKFYILGISTTSDLYSEIMELEFITAEGHRNLRVTQG